MRGGGEVVAVGGDASRRRVEWNGGMGMGMGQAMRRRSVAQRAQPERCAAMRSLSGTPPGRPSAAGSCVGYVKHHIAFQVSLCTPRGRRPAEDVTQK